MATYFPGSNIQPDTMQTLYLMNPDYTGYSDMQTAGNMVLINQSAGTPSGNSHLAGGGHPQQHFIGIPFSSAPHPQRYSMASVESSGGAQQDVTATLLSSRPGNHGYNVWRNVGNEHTFMQTIDPTHHNNHSLSGQLNNFSNLGHQSVSEISPTGMKRATLSSMPEQQLGMNPNGLGLQLDQSQGLAAHGRGLSLSLSPQQLSNIQLSCFQNQPTDSEVNCPSISEATSQENLNRSDRLTSKLSGSLSSFRASSRDGMLGTKFLGSVNGPECNKPMHHGTNAIGAAELSNTLTGSKYFKAAQQLLDEVVNVGKGIKSDSVNHQKSQTWFGAISDKKNIATEATTNDRTTSAITGASISAEVMKNEHAFGLTPADRQELQMKKAKLVAMLDEVDRRYRQYYHQMQIVVSSFETAAGFGAAKTYTSLALKTISRHFRSLRDAIAGQIRLTSKNLGEEDLTGSGKGETSRLHFVDQQLRQQRALQQLGMIQQHAWRPQRGLPERAVSILRAWLFEHFLHPYPKDADKHLLARQTGLTRSQVSNWFINARVRLWKPMVEEMYMEELRETETQNHAADSKVTTESGQNNEETVSKEGAGNSENGQEEKSIKNRILNNSIEEGGYIQQNGTVNGGFKPDQASDRINGRNQTTGMTGVSDSHVFHEIDNEDLRQGQQKKIRTGIQDSTIILPPNMGMDVDLKSEETGSEYILDSSKFASDEKHASEGYSFANNKMVRLDDNGSFGSYQLGGLSRYGQETFTPKYSGIGGVSLTLGLQHCDDLSLSGTQQSYNSTQGLGSGRRHDLASDTDDYCHIHDASAVRGASNYDNMSMQNGKRFATHMLHDFVA